MRLWNTLRSLFRGRPSGSHVAKTLEYAPVVLPARLAVQCQRIMRSFNDDGAGNEGLCYWAGIAVGRGGVVTTLVVPRADAAYGRVSTTAAENARIVNWLSDRDLVLLGQAHSHPPGAGTRHSHGDDLMTFSPFEGQVSVVAADHAAADSEIIGSWGIHRFQGGRFRHIPTAEQSEHLRIVPSEPDQDLICPYTQRVERISR